MFEALLKVNVRQFNEGEGDGAGSEPSYVGDDGQLDVDRIINDYQSLVNSNNDPEPEPEPEPEPSDPKEPSESDPEPSEPTEPEPSGDGKSTNVQDTQKRTPDQAFAEMRRKAEQYEPLAKWVEDLAKQQGFKDPQELIDEFNRQKIAKEAEQKGVPVDVYERLHKLEEENRAKDERLFAQQFNQEVAETVDKHNLSDDDVTKVFQFMGEKGYIDQNGRTTIPFEDAYFLANKDIIIEKTAEQAKQQYLEELEKKQKQSAVPVPSSSTDVPSDELDLSKEGIFAVFKKHGVEID